MISTPALSRLTPALALAGALLVTLGVLSHAASANQYEPPAGNAHPQAQALSSEGKVNPFGLAGRDEASPQSKMKLAAEVNLAPLRDLALYHNGRIKVLDTLARDTISEIMGRRTFIEFVPEEVGGQTRHRKVHFDPLFTFLDMTIDPAFYHRKPLVGVNFLPLREALLAQAFPDDQPGAQEARERWKRIGRLSPEMLVAHAADLAKGPALDAQTNKGLNDIYEAVGLYLRSAANLMVVPSGAKDQPWTHASSLPESHPVRLAFAELGRAWRAGDAQTVNAQIAVLARELPALSPATYPTTRRTLEAFYNRANLFEWGMWLYALSTLTLLLALGTQRRWLRFTGVTLLVAAVGAHALGFGLRCYIAERYAIQNQFESMTGVSLFAALVGLGLLVTRRQLIFGALAAAAGCLILVAATQAAIPGKDVNREAAILNTSVLLKYHVTIVLMSYGLITLGFITALFYLATHYLGRRAAVTVASVATGPAGLPEPSPSPDASMARTLHDLDKAHMTILQLAFWLLGVGILLGAWWADHSWGRWWAFDPKELWALVTWIVYLIVVHLRVSTLKNKALATAWLSVVGFIVMLWCYFGVNLLLPGLHAYA
jgi:cytochrome c-type biogenesis protein CcsB